MYPFIVINPHSFPSGSFVSFVASPHFLNPMSGLEPPRIVGARLAFLPLEGRAGRWPEGERLTAWNARRCTGGYGDQGNFC